MTTPCRRAATGRCRSTRTSGLRLFFAVPRPWTEYMLPLSISESADITRAMIGRIEIVTPAQRKLLATIAAGPTSDMKWVMEEFGLATPGATEEQLAALAEGR